LEPTHQRSKSCRTVTPAELAEPAQPAVGFEFVDDVAKAIAFGGESVEWRGEIGLAGAHQECITLKAADSTLNTELGGRSGEVEAIAHWPSAERNPALGKQNLEFGQGGGRLP